MGIKLMILLRQARSLLRRELWKDHIHFDLIYPGICMHNKTGLGVIERFLITARGQEGKRRDETQPFHQIISHLNVLYRFMNGTVIEHSKKLSW